MFCGYLIVPRDQTRIVKLEYVVPPNVFTWSAGQWYRLVVQHQPGSHPMAMSISVTQDDGRTVSWTVQRPVLDWSTTVHIVRRPFQAIPLPQEAPPVVAPGHWIEPHAFLSTPIK
jgi:hypothetical protein